MKHIISAIVENRSGVLAHIAGLFSSRGFNIDSVSVGRTEDPRVSRMTIVVEGDEQTLEQVRKQLGKVIDVLRVQDYMGRDIVKRDLALIKINANQAKRLEVISLVNIFEGKVVDISAEDMMVEIVGPDTKIDAFVELVLPYGVKEMARTGIVALARTEKK